MRQADTCAGRRPVAYAVAVHRVIRSASAGTPLRLILITLLLAGLALAADRHCADDGLSPAAHTTATAIADMPDLSHGSPLSDGPGGLLGLCLTVLAGLAGAWLLITAPRGLRAALTRLRARLAELASATRPPVLTLLCVSRT